MINIKRAIIANKLVLGASAIALFITLPIICIVSSILLPRSEVWQHIATTVLDTYVINSMSLMLGVGALSLIFGVGTAWLTSMCDFKGKKIFEWALLLPLASPAYIIGFSYAGLLDPAGVLQSNLRDTFDWQYGDYWFPEIRSLSGATLILSFVLYPYIYMLTRAAFLAQSVCVLEVSRTLGCGPWRSFLTIALPLARPAIAAGLALVAMEALADYGTVQFLGVSTFTTGIFRTWFGLGDSIAAAQLASILMGFVFLLILLERFSRKKAQYHHTSNQYNVLPCYKLRGFRNVAALLFCLTPLMLGFVIPISQQIIWALQTMSTAFDIEIALLIGNSILLAAITASISVLVALYLSYTYRLQTNIFSKIFIRISSLGYAVPGAVLAVGIVILTGLFDNTIANWLNLISPIKFDILLTGSFIALIFAYLIRFQSVSIQSTEAGLNKIKPEIDDAAQTLGCSYKRLLKDIHLPIIRGSVLTAALLVFVDVLKELPVTLVMRPFNFNTLAVKTYELATDEQLADASISGIAIVLAGIIPVILLSKSISRSRPGTQH